jgi:putative endonuclease
MNLGQFGEEKAVNYLISNGYEILCRNFRCRVGEIDIVAKSKARKNAIVFFEVKTRRNCEFGLPCESVTASKIKKLKSVIKTFVAYYNYLDEDLCIDIIEILVLDGRAYIRHLENVV